MISDFVKDKNDSYNIITIPFENKILEVYWVLEEALCRSCCLDYTYSTCNFLMFCREFPTQNDSSSFEVMQPSD